MIEDPVLKQRYSSTRSTDADGGEVLHVDTWVDPGGGVTPHVHPAMEERFHVLAGRPSFLAGSEWTDAGAGRGRRGAGRHPPRVPQRRRRARPRPLRRAPALLPAGVPRGGGGAVAQRRDDAPRAAAVAARVRAMAALAERHREMVTLLFPPAPPPFVQRLLFPALARLAR